MYITEVPVQELIMIIKAKDKTTCSGLCWIVVIESKTNSFFMPLKIKKILKGLVLLVCVSYWESFTFNFICGLLQIPGTNHIMKSCSWDIGCVLLMLKEDPLREPLSGGEGERNREEEERLIEGEKAEERWWASYRMGIGREGRERKTERKGGRQQSSCTLSWQISFTH